MYTYTMPTALLLYLQKSLWLQVRQYNILETTRTDMATSTNKAMNFENISKHDMALYMYQHVMYIIIILFTHVRSKHRTAH